MADYYLQRYINECQKRRRLNELAAIGVSPEGNPLEEQNPDSPEDKKTPEDKKAHMEINRPDSPVQRELLKFMIRMVELDSIQANSENILKELHDNMNEPTFKASLSFQKTLKHNTKIKHWTIMEKLRLKLNITYMLNQLDLDGEVNKFEFKTRNFNKLIDAIKKLKIPKRFKQEHINASIINDVSYAIQARYRYDDFYIVIRNVNVGGKWSCGMYVDY